MSVPDIDVLYAALRTGVVDITFVKMDGSSRTLAATLNEDLLPPRDPNKEASNRSKPDGLVTVWSVEDKDWRSFHYDRITRAPL